MKKRVLSALLTLSMVMTLVMTSMVSARAETMEELAKTISTFEVLQNTVVKEQEIDYYKIVIKEAGTLTLDIRYTTEKKYLTDFNVYTIDGENIFKGDIDYKDPYIVDLSLKKGTYYIALTGNGARDIYYDLTTSFKKDVKPELQLTYSLKVGKTLTLGADLSNGEKTTTLTWKSSKSSVASISSKGKVKAKKKGNTIITVTDAYGRESKIKIKVVE